MSDDFIDLEKMNPSLVMDIRYATTNNFTEQVLYPLAKCYLRKSVALKLDEVQKKLQKQGLGLKIYDGYCPLSIQQKLWDIVPDDRYVAPPKLGSKYNRGAAVDLTLVDAEGKELEMPTPFDTFDKAAHRDCFDLKTSVIDNRVLLEKVMVEAGFIPLPTEWWHFDNEHWESYPLTDISLEELGT